MYRLHLSPLLTILSMSGSLMGSGGGLFVEVASGATVVERWGGVPVDDLGTVTLFGPAFKHVKGSGVLTNKSILVVFCQMELLLYFLVKVHHTHADRLTWSVVSLPNGGSIGHIHSENWLFFIQSAPLHRMYKHTQIISLIGWLGNYMRRYRPAVLKKAKMFCCFILLKILMHAVCSIKLLMQGLRIHTVQ